MDDIQDPKLKTEPEDTTLPAHSMLDVSAFLRRSKDFFDYLGGSREEPPAGIPFLASPWALGLWWGLLIGVILLFCGQTSKFIYIDF